MLASAPRTEFYTVVFRGVIGVVVSAGIITLAVAGSAAGCATGAVGEGAPDPAQTNPGDPTDPMQSPLPDGGGPSTPVDAGPLCAPPSTMCGTTCIDTSQDNSNCGACGTKCTIGQLCTAGSCNKPCTFGLTGCGSECVDTTSSTTNCGACGNACPGGSSCSAGTCKTTVGVTAYIDGQSLLVIQGATLKWHHVRDAAPGLWDGNNYPTTVRGTNWFPAWPAGGENRSCNCDSSSMTVPALPAKAQTVVVSVVSARGTLAVAAQPSAANGYTLTVNFDDAAGQADWYTANISYDTK